MHTILFRKTLVLPDQAYWTESEVIVHSSHNKQLRLSNLARLIHSGGEIMNYVTTDAYRIGEFPFWFHQTWTTCLQVCIAIAILFGAVGLATFAAMLAIILTVLCNIPLAKVQHKLQSKLTVAQDKRLKASSEALVNMKALKLYAWENHFKKVTENLRKVEYKWLSKVQIEKGYHSVLFWSTPILVSSATFVACYFLKIPLHANNVFTFVATFCLVQEPIAFLPDVIGVVIQPKVAFKRFIGVALSYGLSLNMMLVRSIQKQCTIANNIISVERLNQYMHIPSEAPEIIEGNRPTTNWPDVGKVEIQDLQVLGKCQLQETLQEKGKGLDSLGKLVEFDEPMKLMKREGSLFGQLVEEYWSNLQSTESH
ncbi:ABC transporter C family member 10-like [Fagus crenata]